MQTRQFTLHWTGLMNMKCERLIYSHRSYTSTVFTSVQSHSQFQFHSLYKLNKLTSPVKRFLLISFKLSLHSTERIGFHSSRGIRSLVWLNTPTFKGALLLNNYLLFVTVEVCWLFNLIELNLYICLCFNLFSFI